MCICSGGLRAPSSSLWTEVGQIRLAGVAIETRQCVCGTQTWPGPMGAAQTRPQSDSFHLWTRQQRWTGTAKASTLFWSNIWLLDEIKRSKKTIGVRKPAITIDRKAKCISEEDKGLLSGPFLFLSFGCCMVSCTDRSQT